MIEDLPRSTIRGMAMGLVEISGRASNGVPVQAPFSQTSCVYYRFEIQEYCSSKGSGYWQTKISGDSSRMRFHIEDDTGRALIAPFGAEINVPISYALEINYSEQVPAHAVAFFEQKKYAYQNWFGQHATLRLVEKAIRPGEPVFVLGVCQKNPNRQVVDSGNFDDAVLVGQKRPQPFLISASGERQVIQSLKTQVRSTLVAGLIFAGSGFLSLWWWVR